MADDFDYEQLDPGIREVVRLCRDNGFETTDSGDGCCEIPCAYGGPMVAMVVSPALLLLEADRLWLTLRAETGAHDLAAQGVQVQASYDPANRVAVLLLTGLDDKKLLSFKPVGLALR